MSIRLRGGALLGAIAALGVFASVSNLRSADEPLVVTATRLEIPESESPAAATVLETPKLEERQINRVADALRGQVFGAVYAFPPGRVETVVAPGLFTVGALAGVAAVRPLVVVGDGAVRYPEEVVAWTGRPPISLEALPPVAGSLLALAGCDGAVRQLDDPAAADLARRAREALA